MRQIDAAPRREGSRSLVARPLHFPNRWIMRAVSFFSLFFSALVMAPGLAHLLELPNKIVLAREEYLTVQQIYRGWAYLGIVIIAALLSTMARAVMVRADRRKFVLTLAGLLCLVAGQIIFWAFTFPANRERDNWTTLPDHWRTLRAQWEYSHAAGALFSVTAFVLLVLSVLDPRRHWA